MKKLIFLSILLISLTSCSIDFDWETDKKILESVSNSPSCVATGERASTLYCIWWNGTCKTRYYSNDGVWSDCWNALK